MNQNLTHKLVELAAPIAPETSWDWMYWLLAWLLLALGFTLIMLKWSKMRKIINVDSTHRHLNVRVDNSNQYDQLDQALFNLPDAKLQPLLASKTAELQQQLKQAILHRVANFQLSAKNKGIVVKKTIALHNQDWFALLAKILDMQQPIIALLQSNTTSMDQQQWLAINEQFKATTQALQAGQHDQALTAFLLEQ